MDEGTAVVVRSRFINIYHDRQLLDELTLRKGNVVNTTLRQGTPEEAGMSAQRVQHIVDLAEGWVAQGIHPALVILVARKGVIVIHEAFGHLTPEQDSLPVRLDTIFPLASISKPMTATLAMILAEEGLLDINRPVQQYIPEFVGVGKEHVMVHHLMTHTSGLRDAELDAHAEKKSEAVEIPPPDETQHPQVNERLFLRYDAPLWKPPGMEMSYSNYGILLLGEIVRRVSGENIADLARRRVFEPLGMRDTTYIVPDSIADRVVKRSEEAWGAFFNSRDVQETPWAAGGVYSTAMDTAIFGQMFLNRGIYGDARILSPESVAEMTRNQIPGISARWGEEFFPEALWGYCWNIYGNKMGDSSSPSPEAFSKYGLGGVLLWVDPVYEIVGCYLSVMPVDEYTRCNMFMNAVTAAALD